MNNAPEKRVAVVTGASSGIGKEAARSLLQQGWRVIGVGRNPARCEATEKELLEYADSSDSIVMLCGDLALLSQVSRVAEEIADRTDRVDALLNNAGGLTRELTITSEGNENTFAANHLGHFLLTKKLLPLLRTASRQSSRGATRIVNVSSSAHEFCDGLDWNDLQMINNFSSTPAYCRAKLANILFTRELAKRLENDGITVHAMHPGMVATNFASYGDDAMQSYMKDQGDQAISAADAADTLVWLASAEEPGTTTGGYYHDRTAIPVGAAAADEEAARRLWNESEKLVARTIEG